MKRYNITVNGTTYEVLVEEVEGSNSHAPVYSAPVAPVSTPAAPKAAVSGVAGMNKVTAPMPGTLLSVNVKAGDAVKRGDVLMILEAMKMENEIMCPCDGTVASINVEKGAAVETGALLCVVQ